MRELRVGRWTPGEINLALLVVQVLMVVQAASRGMDYVLPRPAHPVSENLTAVEAALPLPVWGWLFLALAGAAIVGLAGGWVLPMWVGHLGMSALYVGFAWGLVKRVPVASVPLAIGGAMLLAAGMVLAVVRCHRNWRRFAASMLLVGLGGWTCGFGLGYDFRSATSLLSAAGAHAAVGVGIAVVARRHSEEP